MNIGKIIPNAQGHLSGQIATLAIDMAIHLVPVNSDKERAPKYEICARSPGNMTCYWGNPEATAATIRPDGFLRTGDLGAMDEPPAEAVLAEGA